MIAQIAHAFRSKLIVRGIIDERLDGASSKLIRAKFGICGPVPPLGLLGHRLTWPFQGGVVPDPAFRLRAGVWLSG